MSQDRQWKNPSAARRHQSRQAKAALARNNELESLTSQVIDIVSRRHREPVIVTYSYESLLLVLALDLRYGPNVKTVNRYDPAHSRHSGSQKGKQGDRQALISDAVKLAVSRKQLHLWHDTSSDLIALYCLPAVHSPKWRVFFAEAGVIDDYIPSGNELETEFIHDQEVVGSDINLTDHNRAQLRKWGVEAA